MNRNLVRLLILVCLAVLHSTAWSDECRVSKWGADDQIGGANYVTPTQVKKAAGMIKQGQSHPLGIVVEPGMPAYPPRYVQLQVVQLKVWVQKTIRLV